MKDSFQAQLGERIRELRKAWGLTQEQLAERADVHVSFVGNVERGENVPSIKTLRRIAKALGVSVKDVFDFPDEDTDEMIDEIFVMLKSKRWEIDKLRWVRESIRVISE